MTSIRLKTPPASNLAYVRGHKALNIFTYESDFVFTIYLQKEVNDDSHVYWKIANYFQEEIEMGITVIQAGKKSAVVNLGHLEVGHYVVSAFISDEIVFDNFAVVRPVSNSSFDSPFAINTFFTWYAYDNFLPVPGNAFYDTSYTRPLLSHYIRALKIAGINWVRDITSWINMEWHRGNNDSTNYFDTYMDAYASGGMKVLAIILATPKHYINNHTPSHMLPNDLSKAYDAGKYYGKHFINRINMWEILNEPEGIGTVGTSEDGDKYAAFLKAMSIGFHEVRVPVTMGGLLTRFWERFANPPLISSVKNYISFQEIMFESEVIKYVEVYNFHNHQRNIDPAQETEVSRAFYNNKFNHNLFAVNGNLQHVEKRNRLDADIPIWNTEAGGAIANSLHGLIEYRKQAVQARFLVTSFVLSLSTGVDKHFWFNGREVVEHMFPYRHMSWGIFSRFIQEIGVITPYAAYSALAALTGALGEAIYLGRVNSLPNAVSGHVFQDKNDTVLVLWADKPQGVALNLQKASGILTDIMGRQQRIASFNNIQLTLDPVYLRVSGAIPVNVYTKSSYVKKVPLLKTLSAKEKIVLDQTFPLDSRADARAHGYRISMNTPTPITVTIYNFNDNIAITGVVTGSIDSAHYVIMGSQTQNVMVNPGSQKTLTFSITTVGTPDEKVAKLSFVGKFNVGQTTPTVARFKVKPK